MLGPFGPIHLLSIYVLYLLARALAAIRHGDSRRHGAIMRDLVWWGLVLPGLLARTIDQAAALCREAER